MNGDGGIISYENGAYDGSAQVQRGMVMDLAVGRDHRMMDMVALISLGSHLFHKECM